MSDSRPVVVHSQHKVTATLSDPRRSAAAHSKEPGVREFGATDAGGAGLVLRRGPNIATRLSGVGRQAGRLHPEWWAAGRESRGRVDADPCCDVPAVVAPIRRPDPDRHWIAAGFPTSWLAPPDTPSGDRSKGCRLFASLRERAAPATADTKGVPRG